MNPTTIHFSQAAAHPPMGFSDRAFPRQYATILQSDWLHWATSYRKLRLLGKGGQGMVFLGERQEAEGFKLPVALKIFSPEYYHDDDDYIEDMLTALRA